MILGVCNCYNGFIGDECDVSDTDQPQLSFLLVALCDIQADKCESVVVNGIDFIDVDTLTCHFINQNGVSNNNNIMAPKRSLWDILCLLRFLLLL